MDHKWTQGIVQFLCSSLQGGGGGGGGGGRVAGKVSPSILVSPGLTSSCSFA